MSRESEKIRQIQCFFCRNYFEKKSISREHVFAKWFLRKFGLWDQKITMVNNTQTAYNRIQVPACEDCNNIFGSALENRVKKILSCLDIESSESENRSILTQYPHLSEYEGDMSVWLKKIFYGLVFYEAQFKNSPPDSVRINPNTIDNNIAFHLMSKSVINSVGWGVPSSIFIFDIDEENSIEFDLLDTLPTNAPSFYCLKCQNDRMCECLSDKTSVIITFPASNFSMKFGSKYLFISFDDGKQVAQSFGIDGLEHFKQNIKNLGVAGHLWAFAYLSTIDSIIRRPTVTIAFKNGIPTDFILVGGNHFYNEDEVRKIAMSKFEELCQIRGIDLIK